MDFSFDVISEVDGARITQKIEKRVKGVQAKLDAQVVKDSNFYCPIDTGMLQKSAIIHSVLGSGVLYWRTPYARRLYYGERFKFSHEYNPNATAKWFEVAKSKRLKTWEKLANDEYHKNS